jgi:hypothetical protein
MKTNAISSASGAGYFPELFCRLKKLTSKTSEGVALSLESVVAASGDQISCDLEGEAAILNLKSGIYYGLDKVGAAVWNLIAQPTAVRNILQALLVRFDVAAERCEHDLLALLSEMSERGLVQVVPPAPKP